MTGLYFFTVLLLPSITSAQTIINNTLYENQFACPGDEVVFTCEVLEFDILAWTSDVLIGSDGEQIQFSTGDAQGTRRNSRSISTSYAILTNNSNGGTMRLVSELHVTVPLDISYASVVCMNVVNGTSTTISFTVLGQPNMPQDLFASQLECDVQLEILNINITRCLNTYYWRYSPENATQAGVSNYSITINGNLRHNCTLNGLTSNSGTRISSVFCEQDCAAHVVSVRAINICGREGEQSPDLVLNAEERVTLPSEICVVVALSDAAYQNCALTTLLMAVIIAMNFAHA